MELFQNSAATEAIPQQYLTSHKGNYYGLTVWLLNLAYLHYRWSFEGLYTRSEIRAITTPVILMISAICVFYSRNGEERLLPVLSFATGVQVLGWIAA